MSSAAVRWQSPQRDTLSICRCTIVSVKSTLKESSALSRGAALKAESAHSDSEIVNLVNQFPDNKKFAFTVFDDTDGSTVENVQPVYRFLAELGMRTTKSVWVLPNVAGARIVGATLAESDYCQFVTELQRDGFEIGLHNVRNFDATRELVQLGFERFQELMGCLPRTHCNHDTNRENLYWGAARLESRALRKVYEVATRFRYRSFYQGHAEVSPFFWGDICQRHISYVRNFVFDEINLDRVNPTLPYHDPNKPYVNFWFSSTEGGTVDSFCRNLSEANQDRLEAEGGVCIVYTHFAAGFCRRGELDAKFVGLMRRLAKKDGWFVPVAQLLDHLRVIRATAAIPPSERALLERRWLWSKLHKGTT